ncbi:MAG: hemerythrin domain-containing protein [Hyphomicrobiaceae bacterium]
MAHADEHAPGRMKELVGLLAPPPLALLDRPLEHLLADHFRERCLCDALRILVKRRKAPRDLSDGLSKFMAGDLALHHLDEEEDLHPLLRRRMQPEDGLEPILVSLTEEHSKADAMCANIVRALSAEPRTDAVQIDRRTGELMAAFAARTHRHLAVENGIVLVIARKRLKPRDLKAMCASMKARRGMGR